MLSDSKASMIAHNAVQTKSQIILEFLKVVKAISHHNKVTFVWIPGTG